MNKLLSELKQIVVEFGFTHRWSEIEMWHSVGKVLDESGVTTDDLPEIAEFLNVDEDDIWDAIIFYKQYPDLNLYPSGKNVSWWSIKQSL